MFSGEIALKNNHYYHYYMVINKANGMAVLIRRFVHIIMRTATHAQHYS